MLVIDGYSLMYDERHNQIVLRLPPTIETATNTLTPIKDRRTDVAEADLLILLNITQLIFSKDERSVEE